VSSVLTDESASQIITPPYPHETRHFFIKWPELFPVWIMCQARKQLLQI
jgi:hypothetical protein